jgi:ankyrin repeat protein
MYSPLLILAATWLAAAPQQSLFDAVVNGQTASVQTLINGGADVNAPDENGLTPLALAALPPRRASTTRPATARRR